MNVPLILTQAVINKQLECIARAKIAQVMMIAQVDIAMALA